VPKFYFHLKARVPSEDIDGIELPDVAAAREEAMRFGRELMKVNQGMGGYGSSGDLVVISEDGTEILTMYLPAPRAPGDARDMAVRSFDPEQRYLADIKHPSQERYTSARDKR
jgi:uncharacterized protein DUF6894